LDLLQKALGDHAVLTKQGENSKETVCWVPSEAVVWKGGCGKKKKKDKPPRTRGRGKRVKKKWGLFLQNGLPSEGGGEKENG